MGILATARSARLTQTENAASSVAVPANCLGASVCGVVGICGRVSCIPPADRSTFMDAVAQARSPSNPHRVPDFDQDEKR